MAGYSNCPNAPPGRQSPATQPLLFLDALEESPDHLDPPADGSCIRREDSGDLPGHTAAVRRHGTLSRPYRDLLTRFLARLMQFPRVGVELQGRGALRVAEALRAARCAGRACAWAGTRRRWPRASGSGGAAVLEDVAITEVNEMLDRVRARRAEYVWEPGYARQVLRDGNERANAIALVALGEVRAAWAWATERTPPGARFYSLAAPRRRVAASAGSAHLGVCDLVVQQRVRLGGLELEWSRRRRTASMETPELKLLGGVGVAKLVDVHDQPGGRSVALPPVVRGIVRQRPAPAVDAGAEQRGDPAG